MRKIAALSLLVMFVAQGCAMDSAPNAGSQAIAPGYIGEAKMGDTRGPVPEADGVAAGAPRDPNAAGGGSSKTLPILPSKIIYNGSIDVATKDLAKTEQELLRIVKARGAVLATTNLSGAAPSRGASWKIRVASEQFQDMVRDMMKIGDVRNVSTTSQDVTAEYYDLETRIASKRVEEKRLMRHLTESTGNLRQILDVEHEIARVTTELEQMQGQLRVLANQAALSTLTVSAQEVIEYVPPAIAAAPGFGGRLAATFGSSLHNLGKTGEALLHIAAALLPWAIVFSLLMAATWVIGRRALAFAARYQKASGSSRSPAPGAQAGPSPAT